MVGGDQDTLGPFVGYFVLLKDSLWMTADEAQAANPRVPQERPISQLSDTSSSMLGSTEERSDDRRAKPPLIQVG